jgi:endonuclease/exonuclease/phosphatase family metal-dependent hydrolase
MKNLRLVFYLFAITFFLNSGSLTAQSHIKVMSFNIHHGANTANVGTLDKMAELIRSSGADIVGLQEVDSICKRSGNVDQARYLGEKSGLYYTFVKHFSYDGGSYGQALLSRFPILMTHNERLLVYSSASKSEVALLVSSLSLPENVNLNVAVAHLDYRDEASRVKQVDTLNKILKTYKGKLILMGDMNATPESETMLKLTKEFKLTQQQHQFTFPAKDPIKKIDYILIQKGKGIKSKEAIVLTDESSDHRAIISVLKL